MTAKILKLSDYRDAIADDDEIDLVTAVDAAIRDLREILTEWGSDEARQRTLECELMLRRTLLKTVVGPSSSLP